MIIINKVIKFKKPSFEEINNNALKTMYYIRKNVEETISKEFNIFYSDENRIKKYDWSKVARTGWLGLNLKLPNQNFNNSEVDFEIFSIGDRNGIWYQKGEILERMTISIEYVD